MYKPKGLTEDVGGRYRRLELAPFVRRPMIGRCIRDMWMDSLHFLYVCGTWFNLQDLRFFWVFIMHQIVSYILNFAVEILLILTYDLGSNDQTIKTSCFM